MEKEPRKYVRKMKKLLYYTLLVVAIIATILAVTTLTMLIFGDDSILAKGFGAAAGLGVISGRKQLKKWLKVEDPIL